MMEFILIVGCQRSGTTLMGQIIGAHPSAIMIDEDDGLYNWTDVLFSSHTVNADTLLNTCYHSAATKYREPATRFRSNGSLRNTVEYAILKAPNLTYSYREIPHALPGAKIVYMFRDIRDVVSSMIALKRIPILKNQLRHILPSKDLATMFPTELSLLQQDDKKVKPHIKMALVAKIKMSFIQLFRDNGSHVINVRYEDLIGHPEYVIPLVLKKLGMPYAEECLHHHEVYRGVGPGGTQRGRPIDEESKGKWKERLRQEQENEIWDFVGDFMENMGYTR